MAGDGPDADEFVDSEPYDLTLALRNSFVLNPGETRTYTTTTIFGSGAPEEFTPPSSGFVIDNYIAGATVFFDANQNGILDENEPNTTTDDSGAYELNIPNSFDTNNNGLFDIEEGLIIAFGGTDTATGLPLETPVTALADANVITLLTSLVADLVNQGLSVEQANNQVTTALSIPTDIEILTLDPIVAINNNQPGGVETFAAMVKTQNLITQTAALLAGATNSSISEITDEVVAAITSEIQSSGSLNLTNTQQLETIIEAAAILTNADVSEIKDEVALVIAEANQRIDNIVANSSTDSLEQEFANVQKVSLDKTTSDLQQAGAGNKSIEDVVAENTGLALDDLIAGTGTPSEPNPIFTENVNGTTVEAIDLTGFATDKVTVDYTISREADFNNQVYFYKVDDITGSVGGVAVGESGYLQAALNNLISPVFSTSDDNTESGSVQIDAGSIVVPLIIADGDLTQALNGTAEVYFSYLGANTNNDNFDHIKLLDSNTFGFEDLPNGGDKDFNDIVIKIDSIV
ncbi:MAG: DUF4114 domain-containing protein [Richelia sp. RM1_1_1]|nr:DUF4114 domain-containing protein [Richelia sp. RM1_1_1]